MRNFLKNGGLIVAGSLAGVTVANAAVDVGVTGALTDSATDVGTVGALVLAVLIVVATFRYIKRAL